MDADLPQGIAEYAVKELADVANNQASVFSTLSGVDVKAESLAIASSVIRHFFTGYRTQLVAQQQAAELAMLATKSQMIELRADIAHITGGTPETHRQALAAEVLENQKVVDEFILVVHEEITIARALLEFRKQVKTSDNPMLENLTTTLADVSEKLLTANGAQLKNLEYRRMSMVEPQALTDSQVADRVEAKLALLKTRLSMLEENLAEYQRQLDILIADIFKISQPPTAQGGRLAT